MQKDNPILEKDLELLDTSNEFLLMAKHNGFKNLSNIIEYPISELKQKKGMTYRMLAELGELLKAHELMDLVNED